MNGSGSPAIQSLCSVLSTEGKKKEVNKLFRKVISDVSDQLEANMPEQFEKSGKRLPCIINMLTKEMYLPEKEGVFT